MVKRSIIASLLLLAVTACSSLPEPIIGVGNQHVGYRHYDPCIRCGESWQVLPNEEMAALKHPSNAPKPKEYWESKYKEMYGENWREIMKYQE
jgi:hypothetical protein